MGMGVGERLSSLASGDFVHHHLFPLPSAICKLGILKFPEPLTR